MNRLPQTNRLLPLLLLCAMGCTKPEQFAPLQTLHSITENVPDGTIILQGHAHDLNLSPDSANRPESFRMDDAYVIRLDNSTVMTGEASLQERTFVQVFLRPDTFTTSTECIPKWAGVAQSISTFSHTGPYRFRELIRFDGWVDSVETRKDGRTLLRVRSRGIERIWSILVDADTKQQNGNRLDQIGSGDSVAGWMSYSGLSYTEYMNQIRNNDLCDVPGDFYLQHPRQAVQISVTPR